MSESHPIPIDVLTDHLAILAKTGAGKTYLTKGIVERLLQKKRRVCIVDPKNAWWGLKSSADGKSPAFEIVVFGGPNADVPLLAEHGKVLAEAVATGDLPCIICTKGMPEAQRIRFMTDFFQTLDMKNTEPLHLVIDEAHMMAPQKPLGEMQRLTHWTSELVSGGRGMGFRIILVSQRPARLNKDVLTQCESLVAMRMTGPQDRDAVKAWIHDQADMDKGKEIIASLPGMATGTGWFWAPAIGILKQVKFPLITTYDNSKTKKDGKADAKAKLAPVDLTALQERLGKAKADMDANDPKLLQRRVAELTKSLKDATDYAAKVDNQIAELEKEQKGVSAGDVDAAFADGYHTGHSDGATAMNAAWMMWRSKAETRFNNVIEIAMSISGAEPLPAPPILPEPLNSGKPQARININTHGAMTTMKPATRAALIRTAETAASQLSQRRVTAASGDHNTRALDGADLKKAERGVLVAIAEWTDMGFPSPSNAQISAMSGYSATSSSFSNALGKLRSSELIRGTTMTAIGQAMVPLMDPVTAVQLRDRLITLMNKAERAMFEVLWHRTGGTTRAQLSEITGYSVTSSSFSNALGRLRNSFEVIGYQGDLVVPREWLYLERA